jgi:hypothetical protein
MKAPFRYVFGQPGDANREIMLTVMAFDIPTARAEIQEPENLKTKRDPRKRISRLKSSDRPRAFGADLLNDKVGREIGQEQRGDEHGAEDGFDAV